MRPIALGALSVLVTAAAVVLPGTTAQASVTAFDCEVWRSTGAGLTGFGRCVVADGHQKFQLKVRCSNGNLIYSPIVPLGQTTWATCTAAQGGVSSIATLGK